MNCFFCGTIRDCSKYLDEVYSNVIQMASIFDDYKIVLYYDVSSDDTLNKLRYYANINPRFSFYENREPLHRLRTFRLAKGRNYLISELNKENGKYPYFMMVDWDNVSCGTVDVGLLRNSLMRNNEWDALSFWNSNKFYYDLWALSIKPYVLSCYEFDNGFNKYVKYINNLRKASKGKYIPCYSAFGGLCIYKTALFSNCVYDGKKDFSYIPRNLVSDQIKMDMNTFLPIKKQKGDGYQTGEDCEHRFFHFTAILKNNARIRISPYQLIGRTNA